MSEAKSRSPAPTVAPANPYPHLFRLMHWLLWPSFIILALTGFSQHAISSPDWSMFDGRLPSWFWQGRVHLIHAWASLVYFPAIAVATWLYWRRPAGYRRTHVVLLAGGLAVAVSGALLLSWPGPSAVYVTARWVHFAAGFFVLPIALVCHVWGGVTRFRFGLRRVFAPWQEPRWGQLLWLLLVAAITTPLVLSGFPLHPPWRDLVAEKYDGDTADLAALPWDDAVPLTIELTGGLGFHRGRTTVTLRAMYDDDELFVRAEWLDPTEDRRDQPWQRTADGFQRLVTVIDDERHYYEDKFSLLFPAEPDWQFNTFGCAAHCHGGAGEADHKYGFKGSDRIVDVWHWKATRTDPCGQVDDKYWSELDLAAKDGGRHGDPKDSGGYSKNVSEDNTRPTHLPRNPGQVRCGMIAADNAVELNSDQGARLLADVPIGAIIPGIIAAPATGDRGDVSCISKHDKGRWQLLIRRKLDTARPGVDGRPTDVTFTPGKVYPFDCAAFDNASKRHAYSLTPHRLVLKK